MAALVVFIGPARPSLQLLAEVTPTPPPQPPRVQLPTVNVSFSADSLLLAGGIAAWLLRTFWVKFMQPQVVSRLDGVFAPVEEERLLNVLVTQIGGLTQASRVLLGAFHNGTVDHTGYHYSKITAVNTYVAPGVKPMRDPVKDLPLGRIMPELEALLKSENSWIHYCRDNPTTPPGCRAYLERNDIHRISSYLIRVGNLPIGILSVQWDSPVAPEHVQALNNWHGNGSEVAFAVALQHAIQQITLVMRRRVVRPPAFQRFVNRLKSPFSQPSE